MVGRRAFYDEVVKENDKDMVQSINDTSVVRSLPTIARQAAIGMCLPPHMWSTNFLQPYRPPAPSTADTAMILRVKHRGCSLLNFPWFPIKTQYQKDSSFSRCVSDAGLSVPTAQKPVTKRRGKQKASKKPCTPRKKKGAAAWAIAKKPSLLVRRRTSFRQEPLLQVVIRDRTLHCSRW
jgi:hypothetical protein